MTHPLCKHVNAKRVRNNAWETDTHLEECLSKYVADNLQRHEILDYMRRDFSEYAWSMRTLDRRMRHYNIFKVDKDVSVEDVKTAVKEEIDGACRLLGYRDMHAKLRQMHGLNVPRTLVYAAMTDIDPEGLEERQVGVKAKRPMENFISCGPNWVFSLDGHDKLMGFQNNTFPLAIYGCLDTASRKLIWIKVWSSNSSPYLPARWYLDLYRSD